MYTVNEWTKRDVADLRRYAKQGLSSREAAARLNRSGGATRFKSSKLRIRFRSLGAAHSRKQRARYA